MYLTCYSAAKMEYEARTGKEFWDGAPRYTPERGAEILRKMGLEGKP